MKKIYVTPVAEFELIEALCQTGMEDAASFHTKTEVEATDQKDIIPENPEIGGGSETPPTDVWDW